MPLGLSTPGIDVGTEVSEPAAPAEIAEEMRLFFEFEGEERMAAATQVGTEYLGGSTLPSERLTFAGPTFEGQAWLSHMEESSKSRVIETAIPKLEGLAAQDPALTDAVRRLLRGLWAIVVSRALQVGFPTQRTIVSVFEDPTEQERKAVLRLACNANAAQALAFWDSLESDLRSWLDTLSANERTTFITRMGLRVHWR